MDKMIKKNAQTSIEFLVLVGSVLFFISMIYIGIQESMSDKIWERRALLVKDVALIVQDEINLATDSIDGYSRNFTVPYSLNGIEYELNITEGFVYVRTEDEKSAIALPVKPVQGEVRKGLNNIKKLNGIVELNS